ncbi:MAG TPA: hypothetical protein VEA69_06805 [Tepidisphaeraceae bacterium]|nr:hypothetical protein [Tepidisphaeraceae bacterium]
MTPSQRFGIAILLLVASTARATDPAAGAGAAPRGAGGAAAGMSYEHFIGSREGGLLNHPGVDVVVATVSGVSDKPATNADPPRVELEVHEVLRGDPKVSRARAVWRPYPHDVDYGEPEKNPRYQTWAAAAADKPRVGQKFVLAGYPPAADQPWYVSAVGRFEFAAGKREWALKIMAAAEAEAKAEAERRAAAAKARADAIAKWRAGVTADEIAAQTVAADLVVVGRLAGGSGVEVTRVLKGATRYRYVRDDINYLSVPLGERAAAMVEGTNEYVWFLSETGMTMGTSGIAYTRAGKGDGVVLADADALEAVAGALAAHPAAPPRPVVVLGVHESSGRAQAEQVADAERLRAGVEAAAGRRVAVLLSRLYSAESAAVRHVGQSIREPAAVIYAEVSPAAGGKGPTVAAISAFDVRGDPKGREVWRGKVTMDVDALTKDVRPAVQAILAPAK